MAALAEGLAAMDILAGIKKSESLIQFNMFEIKLLGTKLMLLWTVFYPRFFYHILVPISVGGGGHIVTH